MSEKLKIKIVYGLRQDQQHTIDASEAHKAYWLFEHPNERGTFNDGFAIRGQDIQQIVPDYHATMGWNPTHRLESDDWNELRTKDISRRIQRVMSAAREVAKLCIPSELSIPLPELVEKKYPQLAPPSVERREGRIKSIGEITGTYGKGKNV